MNPDGVARLAHVAAIDLTEEEKDRLANELDSVLTAISIVTEGPTDGVTPTSHPQTLTNVWREDTPGPTLPRDVVLEGAPEAEDGSFAVPQILGEDA